MYISMPIIINDHHIIIIIIIIIISYHIRLLLWSLLLWYEYVP
jgi:hypothetical protein